ncbi:MULTISPECIES: hypothetical protein [Actinomyces]|uniref:hypothetical protein n=1 Tax=Actinomyces TaxID=1654 RepID=UPI0013C42EDF|nr:MULTISPECIES: hypothetical protein [Actinomyces]
MAENRQKTAIGKVLERTRTARLTLDLENDSTKAVTLSQDLSDSWTSPRATDYEEILFEIVNTMRSAWSNLELTLEEAFDGQPDEVEEDDPRAKWD